MASCSCSSVFQTERPTTDGSNRNPKRQRGRMLHGSMNLEPSGALALADASGYGCLPNRPTKRVLLAVLLLPGLTLCLRADQTSTDEAIRELVGRGAIIKRFEVREAETSGQLVRLKAGHLDAGGRVDPAIVEQIAKISDLALELRSLPLSDDGFKALLERTQPIGLDISGSNVTSRGFAAVAQVSKLRWLDVSFTKIGDEGLKSLTKLRELRHVSVMKCAVTDEGLTHIESSRSLRELYLSETRVTDAGVERLRQRLPKCRIER